MLSFTNSLLLSVRKIKIEIVHINFSYREFQLLISPRKTLLLTEK